MNNGKLYPIFNIGIKSVQKGCKTLNELGKAGATFKAKMICTNCV